MADLLGNRPSGPRALRELLASGQTIVAPGAFDALSARLVEQAGFPAVHMTGFGTAASLLGRPDVGLLGLAEMADDARRIVGAVAIPVIADADAGYGNAVNVVRTVQEDERAGVAALHLEDQTSPKRCGHLDDKTVVEHQGDGRQDLRRGRRSPEPRPRHHCSHRCQDATSRSPTTSSPIWRWPPEISSTARSIFDAPCGQWSSNGSTSPLNWRAHCT